MRRVLPNLLVIPALAIAPASVSALGFQMDSTLSLLGQPLEFDAVVRLAPDETLERTCVDAAVWGGETRVPAEQVHVALRIGGSPEERVVHVSTARPLDEPIVTVEVTVGCRARLARRFVAFLDPPGLQLAKAGDDSPSSASDSSNDVAGLQLVERERERQARPPDSATNARPGAAGTVRRVASHARHAAGRSGHDARVARGSRVAALASSSGPRLMLDAPPPVAAGSNALSRPTDANAHDTAMPTHAAVVSSASAGGFASAASDLAIAAPADAESVHLVTELARERNRLQAIEADVTRMRQDAQEMQRTIVALQARLQHAQAGHEAKALVYLIGALSVLLLLGVLALAWLRLPVARRWWDATQLPAPPRAAAPIAPHVGSSIRSTAGSSQDVDLLIDMPANKPWGDHRSSANALGPSAAQSAIGGLEVTAVLDHAIFAQITEGNAARSPEQETAPIDHP